MWHISRARADGGTPSRPPHHRSGGTHDSIRVRTRCGRARRRPPKDCRWPERRRDRTTRITPETAARQLPGTATDLQPITAAIGL
ncbi:hypothetical protein GS506_27380 [Rhodococcus hoagii]|nr:hypothetical protein [Prescottella equi]NKR47442.1 hypothetical protein [Prescottella equi]